MRKQIELTENVAQPACGQRGCCASDTRVIFSTTLNNLHGPEFGQQIAHWNVGRVAARSLQLVT
jgi:hypothetical protein